MTYVCCVVLADLLLKILNIGCFSKNVKGKRLICIKLFVFGRKQPISSSDLLLKISKKKNISVSNEITIKQWFSTFSTSRTRKVVRQQLRLSSPFSLHFVKRTCKIKVKTRKFLLYLHIFLQKKESGFPLLVSVLTDDEKSFKIK